MNHDHRSEERRVAARLRKSLDAWCQVRGASYQARTYDISQYGMCLLVPADMPHTDEFLVQCRLEDGTSAIFEVEERQRRELSRVKFRFLRLGLKVLNENIDSISFFKRLAELTLKQSGHHELPDQRPLHLPAFAQIAGHSWRLETLDMGRRGLSLRVPVNFPRSGIFSLLCMGPAGDEYEITVRERERLRNTDADDYRLNCEVLGGPLSFHSFLQRNL